MSLSNLTPTQRRVLAEMAGGNALHRCVHANINAGETYFLSKQMETVRYATVRRLLDLGLIEDEEDPKWRWRGSHYGLTDAGRGAIASNRLVNGGAR